MASSPLIIVPTTTSVAAVLVSVKARPGNDGTCGQGRATADLDRPCARRPQHVWVGAKKRDSVSNKETGMKQVESGVKYLLDSKSPIQGLLGVHSRYGLHTRAVTVYRDSLSEGFSHFVTSIAAPVASGWSVRRVGLAPTGKRRLVTARANSRRHPLLAVPPQTASVQLSENANADVEKGRPSRSRGQDCPLASMPLRTRRVPSAGINTVHTP
jgi:hypothetical protein